MNGLLLLLFFIFYFLLFNLILGFFSIYLGFVYVLLTFTWHPICIENGENTDILQMKGIHEDY